MRGRRRRLLFIAPVMPASAGNGLAMRAGLFLDALADDHEVYLLVIPVAGRAGERALPDLVARRAAAVAILPLEGRLDPHYALLSRLRDPQERLAARLDYPRPFLDRFATSETVREAAACFSAVPFDVAHVMRLYLAPFARPYLEVPGPRPTCLLDLDDDETATRQGLAALHALRGDPCGEALERAESRKFGQFERRWLPRFDGILVCSDRDRGALSERLGLRRVEVVPNAVRLPAPPRQRRRGEAGTLRLLFVGSLEYFPNVDAARFLCEEVRPRLAAMTARSVCVQLVGASPAPQVRRLADLPGVSLKASVADVGPYYAGADVVAVPVRAGGGTRIKVLEAFAHGVPVVSTPVGAEGLDVEPGRHLLIATHAETFAAACLRLVEEPARARAQAARARALVRARYAHRRVVASIRALYRSLGGLP